MKKNKKKREEESKEEYVFLEENDGYWDHQDNMYDSFSEYDYPSSDDD